MSSPEELRQLIGRYPSALVAYSGGVDSSLVARVAHDVLGERAVAVTALSPSFPSYELEKSREVARLIGIRHIEIDSHEMEGSNYRANPRDRCYFCKSELFSICEAKARELGLDVVFDGFNADDLGDWRPGVKAQREHNIISPLREVGMTKIEIRALSKELGLPTWNKPQAACLSSRFPYGTEITEERLCKIDRIEAYLVQNGFRNVRARWHAPILRIEIDPMDMERILDPKVRKEIIERGKKEGFLWITLDLEGFRSGNMNIIQ